MCISSPIVYVLVTVWSAIKFTGDKLLSIYPSLLHTPVLERDNAGAFNTYIPRPSSAALSVPWLSQYFNNPAINEYHSPIPWSIRLTPKHVVNTEVHQVLWHGTALSYDTRACITLLVDISCEGQVLLLRLGDMKIVSNFNIFSPFHTSSIWFAFVYWSFSFLLMSRILILVGSISLSLLQPSALSLSMSLLCVYWLTVWV